MPYDEDLASRLQHLLAGQGSTEQKMFGGLAFLVHGHLAVAASGQGGILVRVGPGDSDRLLEEPGPERFEMQGRPMKGWLPVDVGALDDDAVLRGWAEPGLAYARSLPPKETSSRRPRRP